MLFYKLKNNDIVSVCCSRIQHYLNGEFALIKKGNHDVDVYIHKESLYTNKEDAENNKSGEL